jgi:hypothetical protein
MGNLVHNERLKLAAANLDRASSAAVVAGVFAPWSSLATGVGGVTFTLWLVVSTGVWIWPAQCYIMLVD